MSPASEARLSEGRAPSLVLLEAAPVLLNPRAVLAVPAAIMVAAVLITCSGDRTIGPGGLGGPGLVASSVGSVVGQVLVGAGDFPRCAGEKEKATRPFL